MGAKPFAIGIHVLRKVRRNLFPGMGKNSEGKAESETNLS